jgi:hypothetical protein
MSIIKHNKTGRIMRAAVFDNDTTMASSLLEENENAAHNAFGKINYYSPEDLPNWGDNLKIEKISGVRIFCGLQQNDEAKYEPGWIEKMFELEMKVCDGEPYRSIAFCHHVLFRKI